MTIRLGRIQHRVVRELAKKGGALDALSIHIALFRFPRARGALLRSLWRLEHRRLLIRVTYPRHGFELLSKGELSRLKMAHRNNPRARVIWVLSDRLAADWQERSAKCTKLEE